MTAYTLFQPNNVAPFTFQPTLDGNAYSISVTWNVFGQRWYVNCYQLTGDLVFCLPLIGSTDAYDISLCAGYFTSTLIYRISTGNFEVSP